MTQVRIGVIWPGLIAQVAHLPILLRMSRSFAVTHVSDLSTSLMRTVAAGLRPPPGWPTAASCSCSGSGCCGCGCRTTRATRRPSASSASTAPSIWICRSLEELRVFHAAVTTAGAAVPTGAGAALEDTALLEALAATLAARYGLRLGGEAEMGSPSEARPQDPAPGGDASL